MRAENDSTVEMPALGTNEEGYDGDPLEIGFNVQYLLDVLCYMPTEEVRMTFKAPRARLHHAAHRQRWTRRTTCAC